MASRDLFYRILDLEVAVRCRLLELRTIIQTHWGHMAIDHVDMTESNCQLAYAVSNPDYN